MFLAIDIGNTNVVAALIENHDISISGRLETGLPDEAAWLNGLDGLFSGQPGWPLGLEGAIVSSVVPATTGALLSLLRGQMNVEPLLVGTPGVELGIKPVKPPAFLEKLAVAMQDWLDIWWKNGFEPIRAAWLARAAGLGERIVVRYGTEVARGVFADLSESGALILALPDGSRREILAADVLLDQGRD